MSRKHLADIDFDGNSVVAGAGKVALTVLGATGADVAHIGGTLGTPLVTVKSSEILMTGPLVINAATGVPLTLNGVPVYVAANGNKDSVAIGTGTPTGAATQAAVLIGQQAGRQLTTGGSVAIGHGAQSSGAFRTVTVVGYGAKATGDYGAAFGQAASVGAYGSAVGSNALAGAHAFAVGAYSSAVAKSIAIGSGTTGSDAAKTTAADTVQLLPNTTTGAKAYLGPDELLTRPVADTTYVNVTGDTMTGKLTIFPPATPNSGVHQPLVVGDVPVGRAPGPSLALGMDALKSVTTGRNNYALGHGALQSVVTGASNVAFGLYAGQNAPAATQCSVYLGTEAGKNAPGSKVIAVGCGSGITAGNDSIIIGDHAAPIYTGTGAVIIGSAAATTNSAVTDPVAVGRQAAAGDNAVALGANARANPKTVQLLANATTGARAYLGADRLFSLTELRAVVAASTDFVDFQARVAALT